MESAANSGKPQGRTLPEAIARTLRHEVGDLLQSVYATVAILQKRLPGDMSLEQRILTDMRARAESCKKFLDAVHDFACPFSLSYEPVDLADLAVGLIQAARKRYPNHQLEERVDGPACIPADRHRLQQIGEALLANACEASQRQVWFQTGPSAMPGEVEWSVADDGPGVPKEHMTKILTPFFTTRHGHAGLGLALANKIAELHGGRLSVENLSGGGFRARVVLPVEAPATSEAVPA
jgi:signal transduction histidine kinase